MPNLRHLSLSSNGQEQVLTIPPDLSLSSTEVLVRKEGDRLIVEPIPRDSLLSLLKTLPELTETWPDIDEGLLPLDNIDGNKRTGHAAMETFLLLNGREIRATVDEQEEVILAIASGRLDRETFVEWLQQHAISYRSIEPCE